MTNPFEVKPAPSSSPPVAWQQFLRTGSQLEEGDVVEYIRGIIPEGITFIGALAGAGKTWLALSMAKALSTGEKLFGVYDVAEICNIVYLTPEVGDKALRKRITKLRMPMDGKFYCQTVKDCVHQLGNSSLEAAMGELKPVVFLDTAIRFNAAADENSASQNAKLLAGDIFDLRKWGAKAVIGLHHSPKYSADAEFMTLENVLRGTGDLGAMCDAVWGMQYDRTRLENGRDWDYEYLAESMRLTRLCVKCVKPRDFDPAPPFRIQGRPYVDERGGFVVLTDVEDRAIEERICEAISANPAGPIRELRERFHMGQNRLVKLAEKKGWTWNGSLWTQKLAFG